MVRQISCRTLLVVACMVALAGCASPRVVTNPSVDLTRDAERGIPAAQTRLGHALLTGKGVEKDPETARYWLGQAAGKGDAPALRMLGLMYLRGDSVPRDPVAAREKLTLAAERSDAVAQGALGAIYLRAEGVERDLGAATYWITRAAAQGEPIF